jgi:hypothetical protein
MAGRTVQAWHVCRGHVAAPGDATCHTVLDSLAHSLTSTEVTHVTTHRVTRGTLTSALMWQPYDDVG